MTIKEQMLADTAIFLDENAFAVKIQYNGKRIPAIMDMGDSNMDGNTFTNKGGSAVGVMQIAASDVLIPETGDMVTYKNKSWTVARILESDEAMHKLQITADETVL